MFIGGCWLGECHYLTDGNYDALGNLLLLKKLMARVGINPDRLRIDWIAASEGSRFAEVMDQFAAQIDRLGPLGSSEGIAPEIATERLQSLDRLVPQLKILVRERLAVRNKSAEAYDKLYASPKVDEWLDALIADPAASAEELSPYYIDPDLCVGCLVCFKKCPTHAIEGDNKVIHVIDQEKCTHCGTCFYACPPKIAAVRRMGEEEIPLPVPVEQRAVVRKSGRGGDRGVRG